ncbi:MAG: DNA-processing protein DprA, partial [Proteobacteria bacterium]
GKYDLTLGSFEVPDFALGSLPPGAVAKGKEVLATCAREGFKILHPKHALYPKSFFYLEEPPLFVSALGNLENLTAPQRLAIVGSRNMSMRCRDWMNDEMPAFLKKSPDVVIVSGGARGADQAAHLEAIKAGRPTICFAPSGLLNFYPPELKDWVSPILKVGGLILSQFAPDANARRENFENRNRLIVTLSHGVFVIEASRRSGSTMTARLANEMGLEIAALPSFPSDAVGKATLQLLKDGAQMITEAEDLSVFLNRNVPLVPSSLQSNTGSDGEETVGEPHGDIRRNLALASCALSRHVEHVVNDN